MNDERPAPAGSSRREFHQALALLALAPLAGPAAAQEQKPADRLAGLAEHLAGVAKIKYGPHLTDEQLDRIKQSVLRDQFGAEQLKRVPLQNGDEPAFIFRADLP